MIDVLLKHQPPPPHMQRVAYELKSKWNIAPAYYRKRDECTFYTTPQSDTLMGDGCSSVVQQTHNKHKQNRIKVSNTCNLLYRNMI